MKKVSIIIPAHNEENTIAQVIEKVRNSKIESEIIVVDNCSTDKTYEIAVSNGVKAIHCENKGKGYAMEAGIKEINSDIVVFVDGDLGIYEEDVIELMVRPILDEDVDFVKSAFEREGGRVTELVAKPLLELLFQDMQSFEQPLSGIISGKTEIFKRITLEKDYGVDIGILLDMIKLNAKIKEKHIGRIDNNSKSWQSLSKMSKEVAKAILKRANYIK